MCRGKYMEVCMIHLSFFIFLFFLFYSFLYIFSEFSFTSHFLLPVTFFSFSFLFFLLFFLFYFQHKVFIQIFRCVILCENSSFFSEHKRVEYTAQGNGEFTFLFEFLALTRWQRALAWILSKVNSSRTLAKVLVFQLNSLQLIPQASLIGFIYFRMTLTLIAYNKLSIMRWKINPIYNTLCINFNQFRDFLCTDNNAGTTTPPFASRDRLLVENFRSVIAWKKEKLRMLRVNVLQHSVKHCGRLGRRQMMRKREKVENGYHNSCNRFFNIFFMKKVPKSSSSSSSTWIKGFIFLPHTAFMYTHHSKFRQCVVANS